MDLKRETSRIYNHPNGSIIIPDKDNDDLGFALAVADIAVTRKKKKENEIYAPNNGFPRTIKPKSHRLSNDKTRVDN